MSKLYIDAFAERNLGQKRELNEDNCFVIPPTNPSSTQAGILSVLGVADGMGGHDAGDVASNTACNFLDHLFAKGGYIKFAQQHGIQVTDYNALIREAYLEINKKVLERAAAFKAARSMGTTCVCGVIAYSAQEDKTYLHFGNIGDSRCYILRGEDIILATQDDSFVWQLYKKGEISYADMRTHPKRNVITQAMGINETITPQVNRIEIFSNDVILLCSDGLHGMILDADIKRAIRESANAREAAQHLIEAANFAGGKDNIAVAVAFCSATPAAIVDRRSLAAPVVAKTKRRNAIIAVWSLVALLGLGAGVVYYNTQSINIEKYKFEVAEPTVTVDSGTVYKVSFLETLNDADTIRSLCAELKLTASFSLDGKTYLHDKPLVYVGEVAVCPNMGFFWDGAVSKTVYVRIKKQLWGEKEAKPVSTTSFTLIVHKKAPALVPQVAKPVVIPVPNDPITLEVKGASLWVGIPQKFINEYGVVKSFIVNGVPFKAKNQNPTPTVTTYRQSELPAKGSSVKIIFENGKTQSILYNPSSSKRSKSGKR